MDAAFEPLPLVIGVTGHRDLREVDVARLEAAVAQVLARIRADYLKGVDVPIIVLTGLAEGADQLVARVALQYDARVIALMPMPIEEYRHDFENGIRPNALAEFDDWCSRKIPMPVMPFVPGSSLTAVRSDPDKRNEQYRALSKLIVRHCDILIALWDGRDDHHVGGTAETVRFKRYGIPLSVGETARASLDAPEIGPVVHIETPRAKAPPGSGPTSVSVQCWGTELVSQYRIRHRGIADRTAATEADRQRQQAELALLDRELKLWRWFAGRFDLTRAFDHEAGKLLASRRGNQRLAKSVEALFAGHGKPCDPAAKRKALEVAPRWCHLYAVADTLAQKWQAWFRRDWAILFLLGFVVFLCFEVFAHLVPTTKHFPITSWQATLDAWQPMLDGILLVMYLSAFAGTIIWFGLAHFRQHQARYLDYRALAEALRVGIYWRLTGAGSVADAYPAKSPRELAWVKGCLLAEELLDLAAPGPAGRLDQQSYAWSRDLWIGGQKAYFHEAAAACRASTEVREWISAALLFFAFALALALLLAPVAAKYASVAALVTREHWSHDVLLFGIGLLPGIAAAFVGHAEQLALKAQSRQYGRMRELYQHALELLPPTCGATDARVAELLRVLGTEAMRESAEWVAIYRQRPIRPPQA